MSGEVKWTPELEVALFRSMHGHKPVGEDCTSPSTSLVTLCGRATL